MVCSHNTAHSIAMFLPAHNEAENLPSVVEEAVTYLTDRGVPYELILVDDGSTDETARVCAALSAANSRIRAVRHRVNMGYGTALKTGLHACLHTGYEWIAFCDADGQFKPSDIGHLTDGAVAAEADAAIGYRIDRADGVQRRLMGRGWHHIAQAALGFDARDVDCGFKAFRRYVVERILPELIGTHASVSPEMLARMRRHRFRTVEVGVRHYPRGAGEQSGASRDVILKSFHTLYTVRRDIRRTTPNSGLERLPALRMAELRGGEFVDVKRALRSGSVSR